MSFSVTSYSQNHIAGEVVHGRLGKWLFIGVYGWPEVVNKTKTWALLREFCGSYQGPILLGGDFNEILSYEEKEGGADCVRRAIPEFREVLEDCELRDLGYVGQWYTWEHGLTPQTRVRERLDRFLGNYSWCTRYPSTKVQHLVRFKSDHTPILLSFEPLANRNKNKRKSKKGFKFETGWLLDETCEGVVKESWSSSDGGTLTERLDMMGVALSRWGKGKFDDLAKKIADTEKLLKAAQGLEVTDQSVEECARLEKVLEELLDRQEAYWYLRSRSAEIRDGDRNTNYFHHKASQRRRKNRIDGLMDEGGVWKTEEDGIEHIVENFYANLFTSNSPSQGPVMR